MPLDRDYHTLDEITAAVREARKARGESQAVAAKAIGVTQPAVSQAEAGRGGMHDVLKALTQRYLGVTYSRDCFYRIEREGEAGS